MKLLRALFALLACASTAFSATDPKPDDKTKEEKIFDGLKFQTGTVSLIGGRAQLKLGDQFEFLNAADARKYIVDIAHNPPDAGDCEGMLVPKGWHRSIFAAHWCAVLEWKEDGYIKDDEYDSLKFDKMLSDLKEASQKENEERLQQGYSKMVLTGWAQPPHYDKATHKLYWAKSYDVGEGPPQLNYDINVLGRAGVLTVSIVSSVPRLEEIQTKAPSILSAIEFTDTNKYTDYKHGDKVAAYSIGGLIGVGLLAKAGFFKGLRQALEGCRHRRGRRGCLDQEAVQRAQRNTVAGPLSFTRAAPALPRPGQSDRPRAASRRALRYPPPRATRA
jgi:uncharacterized membrane-anchored protein